MVQYILTPLCVVGWDFLVVIQGEPLRWVLAALPILAVVGLFLYARKKYEENPEPLELARRQNGFTPDRKMRRYQKRNQKKEPDSENTDTGEADEKTAGQIGRKTEAESRKETS